MDQRLPEPAVTDWRGLCEELVEALDGWHQAVFETEVSWVRPDETFLLDRARAALTAEPDGPAVPESREPASVVGEPSDEDLLELAEDWPATTGPRHDLSGCPEVPLYSVFADEVVEFARAVIARWGHQLAPPAEGEVGELVAWLRANALTVQKASGNPANGAKQRMNRAADLLEQRHPAPVPVAIPGEEYHEDMGAVTWWRFPVDEPPWVGTPNDSDWPGHHTHFTPAPIIPLDARALPLPQGEGNDG